MEEFKKNCEGHGLHGESAYGLISFNIAATKTSVGALPAKKFHYFPTV